MKRYIMIILFTIFYVVNWSAKCVNITAAIANMLLSTAQTNIQMNQIVFVDPYNSTRIKTHTHTHTLRTKHEHSSMCLSHFIVYIYEH